MRKLLISLVVLLSCVSYGDFANCKFLSNVSLFQQIDSEMGEGDSIFLQATYENDPRGYENARRALRNKNAHFILDMTSAYQYDYDAFARLLGVPSSGRGRFTLRIQKKELSDILPLIATASQVKREHAYENGIERRNHADLFKKIENDPRWKLAQQTDGIVKVLAISIYDRAVFDSINDAMSVRIRTILQESYYDESNSNGVFILRGKPSEIVNALTPYKEIDFVWLQK